MTEITISVRNIVEFVLRSGSIDSGYMSANRMQEGTRTHGRVQRVRREEFSANGLEYHAEMRLRHSFDHDGLLWNISGVADGVVVDGKNITVEEIKSTHRNPEGISYDESGWHIAQAKFYGHILAAKYELDDEDIVVINLTYSAVVEDNFNMPSRTFTHEFTAGELRAFFYSIIEEYSRWAKLRFEREKKARDGAKEVEFPFNGYRRGQRHFAALAYRTIRDDKNLFIEAPTGTGKTISVLFPAVKAFGEGVCDKIFYLTAKTITRQAAENAVSMINAKVGGDGGLTYVVITAKDKICPLPERNCSSVTCPRANGHFDRANAALWEILTTTGNITRTIVETVCEAHQVCPYEIVLDATSFADVIICDYNYAFDPSVSLKRFFGENIDTNEKYAFLIDESHNLVDRAREMYSAAINKMGFIEIRKVFKSRKRGSADLRIKAIIDEIINEFEKTAFFIPDGEQACTGIEEPDRLVLRLLDFCEELDMWLAENGLSQPEGYADVLDLYFNILNFRRVFDNMDERYTVYAEQYKGNIEISLLCLDPSGELAKVLKKSHGAVFFSATLTPLNYFRDVFGGGDGDELARFPSPFNRDNLCVVVENRVSTKYKDRIERNFEATADAIYQMVDAKKGNYFAFFSSYVHLFAVLEIFEKKYNEVNVIVQDRNMTEDAREEFLELFDRDGMVLAFAVMGGIFSEGIDLVGDKLVGAAIVGVGLPQISDKRDAIRDYYEATLGKGYDFAYMFPGMNKVMQAAGRVIRTETDRGVLLLIDSRFTEWRYQEMFPHEWRHYEQPRIGRAVGDIFEEFWKENK